MSILWALLISSVSQSASEMPAFYQVPVPEEWAAYSTFSVPGFRVKQQGNEVEIRYTLPLEITGVPNRIRFQGAIGDDGVIRLRGKNGSTMECRYDLPGRRACAANYRGTTQDLEAVEKVLREKGLSEEEISIRLQVAKYVVGGGGRPFISLVRSGGDWEGFLYYWEDRVAGDSGEN